MSMGPSYLPRGGGLMGMSRRKLVTRVLHGCGGTGAAYTLASCLFAANVCDYGCQLYSMADPGFESDAL